MQTAQATYGSSTTVLTPDTLDRDKEETEETLTLHLQKESKRKSVKWEEGTVDNEFLGKKSSKKCCQFHKNMAFDESDSDSEDSGDEKPSKKCNHDHDHDDHKEDNHHQTEST
ncbi:hypothetical protein PROFUN_14509 [Planoprotostelium fungivorum]|uniref:Uncharacterized protein n=1 Tax=Planoprotostelium fungivorum TaxID=1890364 RepID=A0A2P6MZN6_9EUKA|nr:hypothetical protein PROFUN_14509 [Planoprotostelium fungivorum]